VKLLKTWIQKLNWDFSENEREKEYGESIKWYKLSLNNYAVYVSAIALW
jgi:hypothetical protein